MSSEPLREVIDALDTEDLTAAQEIYGPAESWTWDTLLLVRELLRQRVGEAERQAGWQ